MKNWLFFLTVLILPLSLMAEEESCKLRYFSGAKTIHHCEVTIDMEVSLPKIGEGETLPKSAQNAAIKGTGKEIFEYESTLIYQRPSTQHPESSLQLELFFKRAYGEINMNGSRSVYDTSEISTDLTQAELQQLIRKPFSIELGPHMSYTALSSEIKQRLKEFPLASAVFDEGVLDNFVHHVLGPCREPLKMGSEFKEWQGFRYPSTDGVDLIFHVTSIDDQKVEATLDQQVKMDGTLNGGVALALKVTSIGKRVWQRNNGMLCDANEQHVLEGETKKTIGEKEYTFPFKLTINTVVTSHEPSQIIQPEHPPGS